MVFIYIQKGNDLIFVESADNEDDAKKEIEFHFDGLSPDSMERYVIIPVSSMNMLDVERTTNMKPTDITTIMADIKDKQTDK